MRGSIAQPFAGKFLCHRGFPLLLRININDYLQRLPGTVFSYAEMANVLRRVTEPYKERSELDLVQNYSYVLYRSQEPI